MCCVVVEASNLAEEAFAMNTWLCVACCVLSCCKLCVEIVQPIADTKSHNLEIVSTTLFATQNFAHGINDL